MPLTARQQTVPSWTTLLSHVEMFAVLPDWLISVTQPELFGSVLTRSIPEFASGVLTLQKCRAKHLLLSEDGTLWTGTYHLTIEGPSAGQRSSVVLRGIVIPPGQPTPDQANTTVPFGADEWRWYVPELRMVLLPQPTETQLAAFSQLTHPEAARALLEQSMRAKSPDFAELRIASCRPQILRYHPGLRCTMGYSLTYASDVAAAHGWPAFVVAKTYDGDKGWNAYDSMKALWDSPLGTSDAVRIAEPLGYVPELKLLIQGPIAEEQTLRALIVSALRTPTAEALAELDDELRKTAAGLAQLHSAGVAVGRAYSWEDELTAVRAFIQRLTVAVPELATAVPSLFTCLESLSTAAPPDPSVPTHGTFRPSQVLLNQGQIGFIDFDSFCQAEPAMDLALFMISIIDTGMQAFAEEHSATDTPRDQVYIARLGQLASIAERFLTYYAVLRPVSRQRVAAWQALNILDLVLRSWERVKPLRLNHTILMLERHLQAHLP
jgi:thiamine kinase-like enzyme